MDDLIYAHTPTLNTSYNVTGVTTFSYGAYKLLPRSAADVSEFVSIEELTNKEFIFYPNPLNDNLLNISVLEQVTISIHDFSGKLVKTQTLNKGLNSIQLSYLNSGLYFIKFKSKVYSLSIV